MTHPNGKADTTNDAYGRKHSYQDRIISQHLAIWNVHPKTGVVSYWNGVERVPDLRIGGSLSKEIQSTYTQRQSKARHGRNIKEKKGRKALNNENLV